MPDYPQATIDAWWAEAEAIRAELDDDLGPDDVVEFDPFVDGRVPYSYTPEPVIYRNVIPGEPAPKGQRPDRPVIISPERQRALAEALEYVRNYTGTWGLILDIRADRRFGTKYMRLSDRQVEVILAAKKRDAERQVERVRNQTGRDLTVLPIGRTYAAVDNDSGGVTFLIIDRPKAESKWAGWVFVKHQVSDSETRLGSQRPGETYVGQWPSLIDKVLADPVAAVARYGLELGVCGVCNRTLTNAESREAGIGPICLAKIEAGLA